METDPNRYLDVVYNATDRPFTEYPDLLAAHLVERFGLSVGAQLLDVGCGRGEFLRGFIHAGCVGSGVDQSTIARELCPDDTDIRAADLEVEVLPFDDSSFDVVFSKSVIEHFYFPERFVKEMLRVLRPGGIAITMCPDWEANYKIFFEDYTHRTPFTRTSLRDIQLIHGFVDVDVELFVQLPLIWRNRWMQPASTFTRYISPNRWKRHSKFIRFSKELMLLSSGRKPAV